MKMRGSAVLAVAATVGLSGLGLVATSCATPAPTPVVVYSPAPNQAPATPSPQPTPTQTSSPQPSPRYYYIPAPAPRTYYLPAPQPVYPPQAGPGIGNSYPINSQGAVINVRVNPSTASGIIGAVSQDQYVTIDCTQYGDAVTGPWGTTSLWDHINSPYNGYVSDEWVNTNSGAPAVGAC